MHGAVRRLKKALRRRTHAIQVVNGPAILLFRKLGIVFKKESVVVVERVGIGEQFEDAVVHKDGGRHQGAVIGLCQPHQVLTRVEPVDLGLFENTSCQRVLLDVAAVPAFFQGALRNEPIDGHWFALPHAPRARDGLVVVDWVPREIGDDDMVGASQIDADAARLGGEIDDAAVLVEVISDGDARLARDRPREQEPRTVAADRIKRIDAV
eukprot:686082-Prymnesium_polylepis.1